MYIVLALIGTNVSYFLMIILAIIYGTYVYYNDRPNDE